MSDTAHGHATDHAHPTPATYAKIAAVLCIITAIEFMLFPKSPIGPYIQFLGAAFVPLLILLSGIKFALVAMFYMHLKFDHPVFGRLLVGGMFLGAGVLLSLFVLFAFSHPLGV
jgi:hypothetical protein